MARYRTVAEVEADLLSLRAAAERAGMALACLFSSSAEFEADTIRERRAAGAYTSAPRTRSWTRTAVIVAVLSAIFLMF